MTATSSSTKGERERERMTATSSSTKGERERERE